jgi:tRNA uridine 5-carbamoylmethylation protein Kti12
MQQFLIILRGVTASGKSTISKRLRNFEEKVVWLKVDNFKEFFADDSSKALELVNGSAVATLNYLLDQGFSVVMDGVFQNTSAIDEAVNLAKSKEVKTIVYQIKCSLETILERDRTREGVKEGHRKPIGDQIVTQIYQKLEDNPYFNSQLLDTEKLTIDQCIEKIGNDIK